MSHNGPKCIEYVFFEFMELYFEDKCFTSSHLVSMDESLYSACVLQSPYTAIWT